MAQQEDPKRSDLPQASSLRGRRIRRRGRVGDARSDDRPGRPALHGPRIKVALGGRGAEEIVFAQPTTGAESDIQQLTEIARHMVGRWGMSSAVGPLAVIPADGRGPLLPGASEVSEHTQRLIDEEVRRIVKHETLDEREAYAAAGVTHAATDQTREHAIAAQGVPSASTDTSEASRR